MNFNIKAKAEELRSLAAGSIVAGYMAIGTALENPSRIFTILNYTDESLMFSFDGVLDHFPLSNGDGFVIDVTSNRSGGGLYVPKGTVIYVKRIGVATTGFAYVSSIYGAS